MSNLRTSPRIAGPLAFGVVGFNVLLASVAHAADRYWEGMSPECFSTTGNDVGQPYGFGLWWNPPGVNPPNSGDRAIFRIGANPGSQGGVILFNSFQDMYNCGNGTSMPQFFSNISTCWSLGNLLIANGEWVFDFESAYCPLVGCTQYEFPCIQSVNGAIIIGGTNPENNLPGNATLELKADSVSNASLWGEIVLGESVGSTGTLRLGANSQVAGYQDYHGITIGSYGTGTLELTNGARAFTWSEASIYIGSGASGVGYVTVDGPGSEISAGESIVVGHWGSGSLILSNQAFGKSWSFPLSIARSIGGNGEVILQTASTLDVRGLSVGSGYDYVGETAIGGATGTLRIEGGSLCLVRAYTDIGGSSDGAVSTGTVIVSGANSRLQALGSGQVSASGNGTLVIDDGGRATFSQTLFVAPYESGTGLVQVDGSGSEVFATQGITVGRIVDERAGSGLILVRNGGLLRTAGPLQVRKQATVSLDGGTVQAASINLSGGVLAGQGTVTGNISSAGLVSPGNSAGILTVTGAYTQGSAGTLKIEIGADGHDQLTATGAVSLAGTLDVQLLNGFTPPAGAVYDIVIGSSVSSVFATVHLPPSPSIDVEYMVDRVRLTVANSCIGDASGDEVVGIADLLLVIGAWGSNPGHPADINGDGAVGIADLLAIIGGWGACD